MTLLSRRAAAICFGATALAVVLIFASFVYPGFLNGPCRADKQLSTERGVRSYCSETVLIGYPSQKCNPNATYSESCGPPVTTSFNGVKFTLFMVIPMLPPSGYPPGLNITVVEAGGLIVQGGISCTPFQTVNWTTPDGSAGVLVNNTEHPIQNSLPVVILTDG
jgi:hypothetical protein